MGRHRRSGGPGIAAAIIAISLVTIGVSSPVSAQNGGDGGDRAGRETAVVSLGDSYLSGEAGRWVGNSSSDWGDRNGTDRAAYRSGWLRLWRYDATRIYGETDATGCHRSDVAPIHSSRIDVDVRINLACSGAATINLLRAGTGGRELKGDLPQIDRLAEIANRKDVKLIVVSIGGNDLGFVSTIADCVAGYVTSPSWWKNTCYRDQARHLENRLPDAITNVGRVLDDIRAVMTAAGYTDDDYRLVLQGYPSPIPAGDDFRYRESGWSRVGTGGCPFWNVDASWAHNQLVPRISTELQAVAASRNVEFLDLLDAFSGREVCADSAAQGAGRNAEWVRFVSTGILQGEIQESMHPNALGQRAIGTCLRLLWAAAPGEHRCVNDPNGGPGAMSLTP